MFVLHTLILSLIFKTAHPFLLEGILSNFKIAGGEPADIKDYPYQVSLDIDGSLCGGSILTRTYILTAAHCTNGVQPSAITIRAGSNFWNSGGKVNVADAVFQHPQFDADTYDNDIAIIKLQNDFDFDDTVNSIALPPAEYQIENFRLATVTGYGYVSESGPLATSLQKVNLPLINTELCQTIYGADQITERMFCAGYAKGGKDACQGDSGGPLVLDGQVIGIVSFGPDCAAPGMPGAYTKISSMRNFIDPIIG